LFCGALPYLLNRTQRLLPAQCLPVRERLRVRRRSDQLLRRLRHALHIRARGEPRSMHGKGGTEEQRRPGAVPFLQGGTGEAGDRVGGEQVVAAVDRLVEESVVVLGGFFGSA